MKCQAGWHSPTRVAEQEEFDMIVSLKFAIEEKVGRELHHFEIVHITS